MYKLTSELKWNSDNYPAQYRPYFRNYNENTKNDKFIITLFMNIFKQNYFFSNNY